MKRKNTRKKSFRNFEDSLLKRVVAGRHACEEVLRVRPDKIDQIWVESLSSALATIAREKKLDHLLVQKKSRDMEKHCFSHQGCVIFVSESPKWSGTFSSGSQIFLAVDGVSDPHNLGALIRSCWLMGVKGIFIKERRSTSLTAASHKVASGGVEHVPVEFVSALEPVIKDFKDQNFWVYALEAGGRVLHEMDYPERVLWVVGSEDKGVGRSTLKVCDESVGIFQVESSASYNMSASVAMALCETRRQHQIKAF